MEHDDVPSDNVMMITAIIQPFKLDVVTLALERIPGFGGMTVTDCRGFGHGKVGREAEELDLENRPDDHAHPPVRGSGGSLTDFTRKIRLEIAVAGRNRADAVVTAISEAAHTGRPGDGKIFVWPLWTAVRIRTLELDGAAL